MEFKEIKKLRQKCIDHASELLKASKLMLKHKHFNIAYHLATLALEEIGKSTMLVVGHGSIAGETAPKLLKQASEDHEKKLFWAFWSPEVGRSDMPEKQIKSFVQLSKKIHESRIKGLYVDPYQVTLTPSKAISQETASRLISLTESRIKMESFSDIQEPSDEVKKEFIWFHEALEDSMKKKLIFGRKSIRKLNEYKGNVVNWIKWLHNEFDKSNKESEELLKLELERKEPQKKKKIEDKWKIRFKLITSSHSIRQNILNDWNSKIHLIKFTVGKKTPKTCELIVDMILPKAVPIKALWYVAWGRARAFAVSLCIATAGYYWWYLPKDVSKFYEKITDLESKTEVVTERSPRLELDWGHHVLNNTNLNRSAMCYRFLPRDNVDFLNHYVAGISFMGKSDIHTPLVNEIYLQFYHALLSAMKYYKDYTEDEDLENVIDKSFKAILKETHTSVVQEYIQMAEELLKNKKTKKKITLNECAAMKVLCDVYIFHKINEIAEKDIKKKKNVK
jgi:AbiV family abortive infection protein